MLLLLCHVAYVLRNLLTAWIRCPNREWIDNDVSVQPSSAAIHSATHNLANTLIPRALASEQGRPGLPGTWCEVVAQKSIQWCFTNKYVREAQQTRQKRFKHFKFWWLILCPSGKVLIWPEFVKPNLLININVLFNSTLILNAVMCLLKVMW